MDIKKLPLINITRSPFIVLVTILWINFMKPDGEILRVAAAALFRPSAATSSQAPSASQCVASQSSCYLPSSQDSAAPVWNVNAMTSLAEEALSTEAQVWRRSEFGEDIRSRFRSRDFRLLPRLHSVLTWPVKFEKIKLNVKVFTITPTKN